MSKARRKFSVEQKLGIIQEADQNGITQTLRKHNLSHSVFLRWTHQFNSGGVTLLKPCLAMFVTLELLLMLAHS